MNHNYDDLFQKLKDDLKPVELLPSVNRKTIKLFAITFFSFIVCLLFLRQFRPTISSELFQLYFAFELSVGMIAFYAFTRLSIMYSRPGERTRVTLIIAYISLILFLSSLLYSVFNPIFTPSNSGANHWCQVEIFIGVFIVQASFLFLLNREVILNSFKTMTSALMASSILPLVLMQLACKYDPLHTIQKHFSPVFLAVSLLAPISYYFFQKRKL